MTSREFEILQVHDPRGARILTIPGEGITLLRTGREFRPCLCAEIGSAQSRCRTALATSQSGRVNGNRWIKVGPRLVQ